MNQQLLIAAVERQEDALLIVEVNPAQPSRSNIIYANPAFSALTGHDRTGIERAGYPAILGPEIDRALISQHTERVAAGEPATCEVKLCRIGGPAFWAEVRGLPLDIPNHCVLIVHDISDRRANSERISVLSHALAHASDFVIVTDTTPLPKDDATIVYVNKSFLEATGYAAEDLIGKPGLTIFASNNDPVMMNGMRRNIELGLQNEREALIRRKDGSSFWIEIVAKPFVSNCEDHSYRVGIGRDITLRRRAMNQVSLLIGAIENSRDRVSLYEMDREGRLALSYMNEAAAATGKNHLAETNGLRGRIERGERVQHIVVERDAGGLASAFEFTASSIRNAAGALEAIIIVERSLARAGEAANDAASRLIGLSMAIAALSGSESADARLETLRAILAETLSVDLRESAQGNAPSSGVLIDLRHRVARFLYAGAPMEAHWSHPLEDTGLTALRFSLEAAMEQQAFASATNS